MTETITPNNTTTNNNNNNTNGFEIPDQTDSDSELRLCLSSPDLGRCHSEDHVFRAKRKGESGDRYHDFRQRAFSECEKRAGTASTSATTISASYSTDSSAGGTVRSESPVRAPFTSMSTSNRVTDDVNYDGDEDMNSIDSCDNEGNQQEEEDQQTDGQLQEVLITNKNQSQQQQQQPKTNQPPVTKPAVISPSPHTPLTAPRTAPANLTPSPTKPSPSTRPRPKRKPKIHPPPPPPLARRPSTAPAAPSSTTSRFTSESASLRSARYIANQWRSRAVQWGTESAINRRKNDLRLPTTSLRPFGSRHVSSGSITESDAEESAVLEERLDVAKQVALVWRERGAYYERTGTVSRFHPPDGDESGDDADVSIAVGSAVTDHSSETQRARGGRQRRRSGGGGSSGPGDPPPMPDCAPPLPPTDEAEAVAVGEAAVERKRAEGEAVRMAGEEEASRLRAAEAARLVAEGEAMAKAAAEEGKRIKAEEEARVRALEEEARAVAAAAVAEKALRLQAEQDARIAAEEKARAAAVEVDRLARVRALEEEARAIAAAAAAEKALRLQAEQDARIAAEEKARAAAVEVDRLKAEEEARVRALKEEAVRLQAEEAARIAAEEEAKAAAAAEEASRRMIEEARMKAEVLRLQAEEDARTAAEEKARAAAVEVERLKAEEEARVHALEEEAARLQAEEQARIAAEEEARAIAAAEEASRRMIEEARMKAEAEETLRLQAEQDARIAAEEKARAAAAEVERLKVEEEARVQVLKEEAVRLQAEEEARIAAEEEARAIAAAEEANRKRIQEETRMEAARLQAEQDARIAAAAEVERLKAEGDARIRAVEEESARLRAEENVRIAAEEEAKATAAAEEAELRRTEDEARVKADAVEEVAKDKATYKLQTMDDLVAGVTKPLSPPVTIDSRHNHSGDQSLRTFTSESTGAVPGSYCTSENSSVGPDASKQSDFFSLMEEEEDIIDIEQNLEHQAIVPPHPPPIMVKQTQPIHSHNTSPHSAVTPKKGSGTSSISSSSWKKPLPQSGSTSATTIPVLPQHATILTSTPVTGSPPSPTNFGRKRYDDANISFSFALLSTSLRAPPSGTYAPPNEADDINERHKTHGLDRAYQIRTLATAGILRKIMDKFSVAVRQTRMASGILMEADCTAFPISVESDDTYSPQTQRPGMVRNIIQAAVPVILVRGDNEGLKSAEDVIRSTLQKAIKNGDFQGVR